MFSCKLTISACHAPFLKPCRRLSSLNNEKFGQVFLRTQDSGKRVILTPLESTQVSNVSLKWVGMEGDGGEDAYRQYKANTASLRFPLSITDKNQVKVWRLMTLLLPQSLGEIQEPNQELLEVGPELMMKIAVESGYSKEDIDQSVKYVEAAAFPGLCGVGKADESIRLHAAKWGFIIWDDYLDNRCPSELKRYESLSTIINCIVDVIRGNEVSHGSMSQNCIDAVDRHKGYFQLLRREALQAGSRWGCSPNPFLEEMVKYVKSCKLEACLEWNERQNLGSELFHRVQKANREFTVGIFATMEAFALSDGIKLEDSIRDNFVFQRLRGLVVEHVAKTNDLVSFHKEFANGEVSNSLYLLHVERGLSMEETLGRIEKELNSVTKAIGEASEFLLHLYGNDEQLGRFVKLAKAMVTGHILWCGYTKRYYPNLMYDMIVH